MDIEGDIVTCDIIRVFFIVMLVFMWPFWLLYFPI